MLAKINKADAKWLVEEYAPKRHYRVDHSTVPMFLKAYNILKGGNREINCTSCEAKSIAMMSKSMYEQHQTEIESISNARKKSKKTK